MNKRYLIVGQGLAGTILAFKMHQQGLDFKIISSSTISKASDVAAGLYNPLVFRRLTKSWMIDECLPAMLHTYREIETLLKASFLFEKDMIRPLEKQEQELWKDRSAVDNMSDFIREITLDKPIEGIRSFNSYGHISKSGSLRLADMLNEFRCWFIANNLLLDARFEYEDLMLSDDGIEWQGIKADHVVFCEGHRVVNNLFFNQVALKPTKGELLEIFCENLSEDYILNKKLFVLPMGKQKFKIGATYDWNNLNELTTIEARDELLARFEDLVRLPYEVLNQYAGIRPTVSDRRPVLGMHPDYSRVSIFNGLGTKGVMLAPYFANEMIRLLVEDDYCLNTEVDVKRFYKQNTQ